jgi:Tol biopolymer transport system component
MDVDGSHERRLTRATAPEYFDDPAWAPAGGGIAVSHLVLSTTDNNYSGYIEIIGDSGSTRPRRLSQPRSGERDIAPAWSPDGRRIAYLRWTPTSNETTSPTFVRIMDRDGTNDHQVAAVDPATTLDWSPNGRTLLVSPGGAYTSTTATIDVETGTVRHIGNAPHARWSGNGRDIYYIALDPQTQKSKLAQGHLVDNKIVLDRYVPGFTWDYLYPYNGLAVERCS